ncbi:MAG: AmmeMemoRadiSam system radical SAM enzyme [Candidatus Nanopelagicales bacterium]|jgi:pyruvate formate lyase activating enzyme|nr:AmmeMemoRadiSam system radical SAM enzyme [Candidatus Nanopelagicales bacterium]
MGTRAPQCSDPPATWPGRWWHVLDDGRIQCDLCPRECRLHDGQRGLCFVRAREGDAIVSTTYGRSSGYCVDPIEKKPLNHFLPGSSVLSFGTAGCNLTCKFCQNWDISKSRDIDTLADAAMPEDIALAAERLGCASVAFTYNDPVIFAEYAIDTAVACRARGIRTVAVTAGYINPEPRVEFYRHMDAVNIDLKGFSSEFYHRVCGADLAAVLDTIEYVATQTDTWLELTTLVIPGHNDSEDELDALTRWVVEHCGRDVPMHFSAFHPDWKMLDVPATPPATLARARAIAMANGVRYAYTGNVHDRAGDATTCPGCHRAVIERDWYDIRAYRLHDDGRCRGCGTRIAGVFDGPAGSWGRRRLPVRIAEVVGSG